jgi:RNA polymerase sigma factor (sigma-70 family)
MPTQQDAQKTIRVLLADDHTLVRTGIRSLLQDLGIQVVAEAGSGREALRLIEEHRPDVVLMDITMPDLNGLEVTARVTKEFPDVRVIMLSMHANERYAVRALRIGAAGYLIKDASAAELEQAIMAALRGDPYLSPAVWKHVAEYIRHPNRAADTMLEQLTPRQRQVLQLIAEGHSTQEIAQLLGVSVKTVETHRIRLMERLNIHEVAGLARYAIQEGLVELS